MKKDGKSLRTENITAAWFPRPLPKDIVEFKAARHLIDAGYLVIFCGGGGIPVVEDEKIGLFDRKRGGHR